MHAEEIPSEPDNMKDQEVGTATIGHSRETTSQSGSFGSGGDRPLYLPNVYAPQAQAFYYRGFDNGNGEWDEYPSYVNSGGIEIGSPGVYNENQSLVFHSGYGFNPQMPYGSYSPVTSPLPSVGVDAQPYSPQQCPYTPPYYHQLVPPSLPYLNSPTQVSQPQLTNLLGIDQPVDSNFFGPRSGYPSMGSFGRGSFPVAPGSFSFHESQQGFNGSRSGGLWSDCSKPSERQRSLMSLSPSVSPQPSGSLGTFGPKAAMHLAYGSIPKSMVLTVVMLFSCGNDYFCMPLHKLDIENTFHRGELKEEIYMEQPPSFVAKGEYELVCKLRRGIYGLNSLHDLVWKVQF